MRRYFPLSAFEHDTQAVIAADHEGTVLVCNHAAGRLLGVTPAEALSRRCWTLQAFRHCDGSAFCGRRCPVRRAVHEGQPGVRHRVIAGRGPSENLAFELISFLVPSGQSDRCGVVHLLHPQVSASAADGAARSILQGAGLTAREREVLQLMAAGLSTRRIAETLGIRANTVRNHTGRILRKLGAHRRIEAVIVALHALGREAAPASNPGPGRRVEQNGTLE